MLGGYADCPQPGRNRSLNQLAVNPPLDFETDAGANG
jgi:hypothetical protein